MSDSIFSVQVRWHDVVVEVNCNHAPIINHIREHVRPLVVAEAVSRPQISVNVNWREAKNSAEEYPLLALAENRGAHKIGKRLFRIDGKLLWTDIIRTKNMVTLLEMDDEQLRITYDHYFELPEKKLQRNPNYRYEKYFSLLKYFLYFPMIWYNEQFRGRYVMHASGVSLNGNGVVLGGVGGVGKTTTCIGLLTQENTRLLSENLVFFDANKLYQLYEPIRLDDNSVALLGDRKDAVYPTDFPEGTRAKQMFHVHENLLAESCPAAAVILPEFSNSSGSFPVSAELAVRRLENYNQLTREVNDYYWYAATLNLLDSANSLVTAERIRTLQELLRNVPAFQLNIDRANGVPPVVAEIANLAQHSAVLQ